MLLALLAFTATAETRLNHIPSDVRALYESTISSLEVERLLQLDGKVEAQGTTTFIFTVQLRDSRHKVIEIEQQRSGDVLLKSMKDIAKNEL